MARAAAGCHRRSSVAVAGARHRRQCRALQPGRHTAAEILARARTGSIWCSCSASAASGKKIGIDRPAYDALRSLRDTYEDVAEYTTLARPTVIIDGAVEPERLVAQATGNFFRTARRRPGRRARRGRLNRRPSSAIGLWQTRFGGDRAVVGRTITVNSAPYVITGVAASGFGGVSLDASVDIWLLLPAPTFVPPSAIARLRPGRDDGAGAGRH